MEQDMYSLENLQAIFTAHAEGYDKLVAEHNEKNPDKPVDSFNLAKGLLRICAELQNLIQKEKTNE